MSMSSEVVPDELVILMTWYSKDFFWSRLGGSGKIWSRMELWT